MFSSFVRVVVVFCSVAWFYLAPVRASPCVVVSVGSVLHTSAILNPQARRYPTPMPPKRKLSGSFAKKQTRWSRRSTSANSASTPPNDQLPLQSALTSAPNTPPNVTGYILSRQCCSGPLSDGARSSTPRRPQSWKLHFAKTGSHNLDVACDGGDVTLAHVRNNTRLSATSRDHIAKRIQTECGPAAGGVINAEKARGKIDNVSLLYLLSRSVFDEMSQ